jgi:GNAT superfamily N-acetyltransferase
MDDPTLAAREHENMVAAMTMAASQAPEVLIQHDDGVLLMATGLPVRLFNQVLVEADDGASDAIGRAVATTRGRGDHFVVNLRVGYDDGHLPAIESLGLTPISDRPWMPGMALYPLPEPGTAAAGPEHEIRRVTDAQGVAEHIRTGAAGFGMPQEWLEAIMTTTLANTPGVSVYVGYTDGEPVTTGMGIRTGSTIGVYNIATVERARKRGYGAAMTMRIVDDGAAEGCNTAILQASDMGLSVYEHLGFRTVVEYMGYVDPE